MATLNIRNLPDDVHASLRIRAARAGRSMEAEAREILAQAVSSEGSASPDAIQAFVRQLYDEALPDGVVDELIQERRREAASEE